MRKGLTVIREDELERHGLDTRYSIAQEYGGNYRAVWTVRYKEEWIGEDYDPQQAIAIAQEHRYRSRGAR